METPSFPSHLFGDDFENVYQPAEDTFLLLDALEQQLDAIKDINPSICLEVGSGSGAIITSLAKALGPSNCFFMATDINLMAAETTRKCGSANAVPGAVEVVVTDLVGALEHRLKGSVDVIIFNPPYVPTSSQEVEEGGISRSWAGGKRGREVIDRFLPLIPSLLSPKGKFFMIALKENIPQEICNEIKSLGVEANILLERRCGSEYLYVVGGHISLQS